MADSRIEARTIPARVHGRFLVRHSTSDRRTGLLVGCHGYAENAEAQLIELEKIRGVGEWTVVAVQALHPFYNSRTGDVVAGWMTKQDRELAIEDNIQYLSDLVREVRVGELLTAPLVYLGFSQGVAMAYRAAAGAGHLCHGVVAFAGDVPPELAEKELGAFPPVLLGRGDDDEWYGAEKLAADERFLKSRGVDCRIASFPGGHEWTDEFRDQVSRFLIELTEAPDS